VNEHPSIQGLAIAVGDLLNERFLELEQHVGALTTRARDLELTVRSLERRVQALQEAERVRTAAEGSSRGSAS
jgi:hypothetical protein